ncbi:MAG: tRNA lysidine(34) synthetase TilS [Pseudomonadota bacterium]|nr:tRNA lysidine(34) synthetase TilS [Pseudomonadota bacterium]
MDAGARVALALSGGVDSMALLEALTPFVTSHPLLLSAIHIHHGLSPNADRWAHFCAEQCALRSVPLTVHRLRLKRGPGQSLEALARAARYECLMAAAADVVALAHHADDQAETVLLQLLRGAGPRGVSAMPGYREGRPSLWRPLLSLSRQELRDYASSRSLAWIEDESNVDTKHKRNLLRHAVAPLLSAGFPGYPGTLFRAAAHQAEASALLDELAALDAVGAVDELGLDRASLASLPTARAGNLLRWFLRREGLRPPSQARLSEMLRQLVLTANDAKVSIAHEGREIGVHRGRILVHARPPEPYVLAWHGEREVRLPWGALAFIPVHGAGLCADKLNQAPVSLRSRTGGERIQLAPNRPHHAVKKLLQHAGLARWERDALPLVWCGDELAAVPGIGVALAFQAAPDEAGWRLDWRPLRPD